MIRRSQMLQSGVTVDEGPTLDEIHAEEKAAAAAAVEEVDVLAAAEASAELSEINESPESSESDEEAESTVEEPEIVEDESDSEPSPDFASMTVAELKVLLKEAGKPVSGKKADLVARLQE